MMQSKLQNESKHNKHTIEVVKITGTFFWSYTMDLINGPHFRWILKIFTIILSLKESKIIRKRSAQKNPWVKTDSEEIDTKKNCGVKFNSESLSQIWQGIDGHKRIAETKLTGKRSAQKNHKFKIYRDSLSQIEHFKIIAESILTVKRSAHTVRIIESIFTGNHWVDIDREEIGIQETDTKESLSQKK